MVFSLALSELRNIASDLLAIYFCLILAWHIAGSQSRSYGFKLDLST